MQVLRKHKSKTVIHIHKTRGNSMQTVQYHHESSVERKLFTKPSARSKASVSTLPFHSWDIMKTSAHLTPHARPPCGPFPWSTDDGVFLKHWPWSTTARSGEKEIIEGEKAWRNLRACCVYIYSASNPGWDLTDAPRTKQDTLAQKEMYPKRRPEEKQTSWKTERCSR